eukprot:5622657-Pleurochrysis_carterae.AAC.3
MANATRRRILSTPRSAARTCERGRQRQQQQRRRRDGVDGVDSGGGIGKGFESRLRSRRDDGVV